MIKKSIKGYLLCTLLILPAAATKIELSDSDFFGNPKTTITTHKLSLVKSEKDDSVQEVKGALTGVLENKERLVVFSTDSFTLNFVPNDSTLSTDKKVTAKFSFSSRVYETEQVIDVIPYKLLKTKKVADPLKEGEWIDVKEKKVFQRHDETKYSTEQILHRLKLDVKQPFIFTVRMCCGTAGLEDSRNFGKIFMGKPLHKIQRYWVKRIYYQLTKSVNDVETVTEGYRKKEPVIVTGVEGNLKNEKECSEFSVCGAGNESYEEIVKIIQEKGVKMFPNYQKVIDEDI